LKFVDLPQTQVRGRSKEIPKTAIEVKGPLGKRRCFMLECLGSGI
jgi:large subunit ribosomal protein L6